jgi:thiol-disulfide isomerase/thioredoxin
MAVGAMLRQLNGRMRVPRAHDTIKVSWWQKGHITPEIDSDLVAVQRSEPALTAGPAARLTGAQIGHALGERATLLQFSSAFCAPCRATRRILADVAGMTEGVAHVEIDAESRLDLVRQLNVLRTPTVLVLDAGGGIVRRASGQPRKADVIAAIGSALEQ